MLFLIDGIITGKFHIYDIYIYILNKFKKISMLIKVAQLCLQK